VLAWLLGEPAGKRVGEVLRSAEQVAASELVILECERALVRCITLREIDEARVADLRARLRRTATHWLLIRLSPEIVERACQPFPNEPVRTLDALHLATALAARSAIPGLDLLSLDERIRGAGRQLGFHLQPA